MPLFPQLCRPYGVSTQTVWFIFWLLFWRERAPCLGEVLPAAPVYPVLCSNAVRCLLELGSKCGTQPANRSEPFLERQIKWLDKIKVCRDKVVPWSYSRWVAKCGENKAPLLPSEYHTHQITHYFTSNVLCLSFILWITKVVLYFCWKRLECKPSKVKSGLTKLNRRGES